MTERSLTPVSTGSPSYRFTFPGCPSPVRASAAVIEALQRLLREATEECQGLLYGIVTTAGTEVRSCCPIASFGMDEVGKAISEARPEGDAAVVGYYRLRPTAALQLSDAELAIAEIHFSARGSVVLLIRQDRIDSEANFFFREKEEYVNFPLLSFPLDVSRLQFTSLARPGGPSSAAAAPAVAPAATAVDTRTRPEAAEGGRRHGGRKLAKALGLTAGFVLIAAAGAGLYVLVQRRQPTTAAPELPATATAAATSAGVLPLRVERQGPDLKLGWDPNSPGIASATSGVLDINDGGADRRIPLGTAQIRFGSVVYSPVSDQVSLRLTALQADGTAQEGSVLIVLAKPGAGGPADGLQVLTVRRSPVKAMRPFVPPAAVAAPAPSGAVPAGANPVDELPAGKLPAQTIAALPLAAVAVPPPPAPAERAPKNAEGGSFVPPVLVSQVGVRTPPALRGFEKSPVVVAVRVVVNELGRVVSATAIPQKQPLHVAYVKAAEDAARRCQFRPALSGSTAVRSEVTMNFRFMPLQ